MSGEVITAYKGFNADMVCQPSGARHEPRESRPMSQRVGHRGHKSAAVNEWREQHRNRRSYDPTVPPPGEDGQRAAWAGLATVGVTCIAGYMVLAAVLYAFGVTWSDVGAFLRAVFG